MNASSNIYPLPFLYWLTDFLENQILFELFKETSNKKEINEASNSGFLNIKYDDVFYKLHLSAEKTILDIALQAKINVAYGISLSFG